MARPAKERKSLMEATAAVHTPEPGVENPEVNNLLLIAQDLADQKAAVFAKIDANRQILRQYKVLGYLSEEQVSAIDEFYPPHRQKAATDTPAETPAPADTSAKSSGQKK